MNFKIQYPLFLSLSKKRSWDFSQLLFCDLELFVQRLELEQVLVAGLGVLFVLLEELGGALGEGGGETRVAGLVLQEVLIAALGLLAVEREGLLRRPGLYRKRFQ